MPEGAKRAFATFQCVDCTYVFADRTPPFYEDLAGLPTMRRAHSSGENPLLQLRTRQSATDVNLSESLLALPHQTQVVCNP